MGDGEEDPVDHEAEEQEEDARRHPGQNDEGQGQLSPQVGHPDGVEGVLELHFPQGLVTDSILFCQLFASKVHCKKVYVFMSTQLFTPKVHS